MSFASARMRGSLSCMRPAVSTRTTSHFCRLAALIASAATFAGSFSYPRSNRGTFNRLQCVRSCSTAPALNVSHAAIITVASCCNSQYATFDKFVLLPTPLTPTKVMTYGRPASFAARTSRNTSTDRFGVRMRVNASSIAALIIELSDEKLASFFPSSDAATDSQSRSAMSSATFLFMKLVLSFSSTGARSSRASADLPTTPRTSEFSSKEENKVGFFVGFDGERRSDDDVAAASSSSSSELYSSSSSASTRLGLEMSTRSTSSSPAPGGLPSEKSRPSVLPFAFSPAQTRFVFSFFFGRFSSSSPFFFSSSSPRDARLEPLLLFPPLRDFRDARILDMSNAFWFWSRRETEASVAASCVASVESRELSSSKASSPVAPRAAPLASLRFAAFFAASNAFGARSFGARRSFDLCSAARSIFVNVSSNSGYKSVSQSYAFANAARHPSSKSST
mmetsp:Transcript_15035/g.63408  ORF Transcript_15035/g.63408 Transcript_15035/m.63408 type:complete len:451 (+) Transcript_15035:364-1716(+)